MKHLLAAVVFCLCSAPALAGDATGDATGEIAGPARVLSGDTLEVGGAVVQLYGIQAPHPEQTCRTRKGQAQQCGRLSAMALTEMVRGPDVRCAIKDRDQQGRALALCFVGWLNVSEEMVASGYAMADPDSGADFDRAQTFAQARREGLWQTEFTPPWEWPGEPSR